MIKIAYATEYNASDVHNWSGTGHYIAKALEAQGAQLDYVPFLFKASFFMRLRSAFSHRILRKKFMIYRENSYLRDYAHEIERKITTDTQVVLSPNCIPFCMLCTDKLKVIYTDATFASLENYYDYMTDMSSHSSRQGNRSEKMALSNCDLAIFSSDWAARSAIDDYGADPEKVKVVPFGANIECNRTQNDIRDYIKERSSSPSCDLLFIGVDWERKGGDKAVAIAQRLHDMGIPVKLDIVGNEEQRDMPSFIVNHGFISKATAEGRARTDSLFCGAQFFILPTLADCTPIVFNEAASWGLPVVTTDTGGIPSIILDTRNGMKFAPDSDPQQWADYIAGLWNDKVAYEKLALASFDEYIKRLNWDVTGKTLMGHIHEALEKRKKIT